MPGPRPVSMSTQPSEQLLAAMQADRTKFLALLANVERSKSHGGLELTVPGPSSAVPAGTAVLSIKGVIGSYWDGLSSADIARELKQIDGEATTTLEVHVHSPGGSMWDGIDIMNSIREWGDANDATVVVKVTGIAASAASLVALAGEEIVMYSGAQMMIHDAWIYTVGNEAELTDEAAWLGKQSQNGAQIYADFAGGTAQGWRDLMRAETWYTAEEAVAAGLATRVEKRTKDDKKATASVGSADPGSELEWDLSMFTFAGRAAAPAPAALARPTNPPADPAGSTEKEETAVAFTDEQLATLRSDLELADDATEADILVAVAAKKAAPPAGGNQQIPPGSVLVDEETWATTQAQAADGVTARKAQVEAHRKAVLDEAVRKGKFPSSRREHYESLLKADPEGSEALIDSLAEGTVPLQEAGHDDGTQTAADDLSGDAAASNWERDMGLPAGSVTKGVPA